MTAPSVTRPRGVVAVLRVTAELSAPVAADHDLHLDAVLAAKARNYMGSRPPCRSSLASSIEDPVIPVVSVEHAGVKCWIASAWDLPDDSQREETRIVRRRDGEDVLQYRRGWATGAGAAKPCYVRTQLINTPSASWLCFGNRREVASLLKRVHAIGRVRRHGYGAIKEWSVERVDMDPAEIMIRGGEAQRHLPASWVVGGEVDYGAYRPPYWHSGFLGQRVAAGTKAGGLVEPVREVLCASRS